MKLLKWLGIAAVLLVVGLILLIGGLYFVGSQRLAQAPQVTVRMIDIPIDDEAAQARGEHLAQAVMACQACHEGNYKGKVMVQAPLGAMTALNLTTGLGGLGDGYSEEDWLRAIRHGVGQDGRTLVLMPISWYAYLSDEDTAALIAYFKSLEPVDNELPPREVTFLGNILLGVLGYSELPVSLIDHETAQPATSPPQAVTDEYGEYLTKISVCGECHGRNYAGRVGETGPPAGPNLTQLTNWDEVEFMQAMRLGQTPDGRQLDPKIMPWPYYGQMTDLELQAIWTYLQTLPPRELGDNG